MTKWTLLWALTCACTSKKTDTNTADSASSTPDPSDDTSSPDIPGGWGLLADELGSGSLLSAWTSGDITHMVGGDMHGGSGLRVAYDGSDLCIEADITERALWWIHGDRDGRWVAVGEAGTVLLEEDGVRTQMDIPSDATFYGAWVTADTVTAVGGTIGTSMGEIWRHQDGDWSAIATDLPGVVFKVWNEWIVGQNVSYRLSENGTLEDLGDAGRLLTVRGDGSVVTAVGGVASSLIMQHDGSTWTELSSAGLGQPLNGIWTDTGEDLWVAGNFGTTARIQDGEINAPDWPVTSHHFHAVWPHSSDEMLFMGGNFMSSGSNFATIGRHGPAMEQPEVESCE
jgi:hypothetical protein